jgi:CHAD domain-containing protein
VTAGVRAALAEDFRKLAHRAATTARRTRTRADGEAIHDLRVVTRRLGAWLDTWKPTLRPRRRRRIERALRRLRRALGEAREAQVHEAMLRERLGAGPQAELSGTRDLLEHFARRTARHERRASAWMLKPRVRRLLLALAQDPPLAAGALPDAALLAHARARVDRLEGRARTLLERAKESAGPEAHQARIAVKRTRYALERLEAAGGRDPESGLKALTERQESLGLLHDLATLTETLERTRDKAAEAGDAERARAASILLLSLEREARDAHAALQGAAEPEKAAHPTGA